MKNKFPSLTSVLLSLSLTCGLQAAEFSVIPVNPATAEWQKAGSQPSKLIRFSAAQFDPLRQQLVIQGHKQSAATHQPYALIQLYEHEPAVLDQLAAQGVEIMGYYPDDTFLVKMSPQQRESAKSSGLYRYVGAFKSAYKISPPLIKQTAKSASDGPQDIVVMGFRGGQLEHLTRLISKFAPGASIEQAYRVRTVPHLVVRLPAGDLSAVFDLIESADVRWVDRFLRLKPHNIDSVGVIQSSQPDITDATIWQQDLLGTGQIVAVVDSGLDRNQDFFSQYNTGSGSVSKQYTNAQNVSGQTPPALSPDNKVIGYFVLPGASAYDDNEECSEDSGPTNFHGTHVAGTVAGDSGTPASSTSANYDNGDGMAPHAQILFQDIGDSQSGCLVSVNLYDMFVMSANAGAGISNNSYGTGASPDGDGYFPNDQQADAASYDIEDLLIVFSAGNDGNDGIGHPATAKNVLSVAAMEHGDNDQVAVFSSKGPAYDDRIKPDIAAPGVRIVSAAGNTDNSVPPANSVNNGLASLSGTSMAAPTVAGGAALMRQYFMDGFYPGGSRDPDNRLVPSSALMKSVLLNGTNFIPRNPSIDQGWGRIHLDSNLYFSGDDRNLRVWDLANSNGLTTGEDMVFNVQVPAGETFRATLVWTDPPAEVGTGKALVNDLDLEVSFNGDVYRGNRFSSGASLTGGNPDTDNNVEQVIIPSPASGVYEVRVKGTQVNGYFDRITRKQGFGLVTSHGVCSTSVNGQAGVDVASDAAGDPEIVIDPMNGVSEYQVYRQQGGCAADGPGFKFIGQWNSNSASFIDEFTETGVEYGYAVKGVDACGEGAFSACKSITSTASCAEDPQFNSASIQVSNGSGDSCQAQLNWNAASSRCAAGGSMRYNIYRSSDPQVIPLPENRLASGVLGTSYTDLTVTSGEPYYYLVTPVDPLGNEGIHQDVVSIIPSGSQFTPGVFTEDPDQGSQALLQAPWQITDFRASTGSLSYKNADRSETYPPNTCAFLTLPEIELQSGQPVLSYDSAYLLEENWDGVVVQISTDGGQTFSDLPPDGGYPSDFSETEPTPGQPVNACGFPATQGAFNGLQAQFTGFSSDLSQYAGDRVVIRFAFSSDPGVEQDGFYLDNVQVTNASSPGQCEVSNINQYTSGPWYNPAQDGHGLFLEVNQGVNNNPDALTAYWYTFLDGQPSWLFGTTPIEGDSVTMQLLTTDGPSSPPDFDPNDLNVTTWGDVTIDFTGQNDAEISWDSVLPGYGSGSMPLTKIAALSDSPKACLSGSYSDPAQSGHGFVVEIVGAEGAERVLISWYSYDAEGNQIWLLGQAALNGLQASVPVGVFSGADFPPEFDTADVVNQTWGTLALDFSQPGQLQVDWDAQLPGYQDGQITTNKFTLVKGKGCF